MPTPITPRLRSSNHFHLFRFSSHQAREVTRIFIGWACRPAEPLVMPVNSAAHLTNSSTFGSPFCQPAQFAQSGLYVDPYFHHYFVILVLELFLPLECIRNAEFTASFNIPSYQAHGFLLGLQSDRARLFFPPDQIYRHSPYLRHRRRGPGQAAAHQPDPSAPAQARKALSLP